MDYSNETFNPWSNNREPDEVDELLQIMSDYTMEEDLLTEKEITEICSSRPTGRRMEILQNTYDVKMTLQKTKLLQLGIKLEQDAPDVTHSEQIKIKTEAISQMITALDAAISENQLYDRLAGPLQDKTLKLQAKYHEDTVNGFIGISKCLSQLQENLDTIDWHKTHSLEDENVSQTLKKLHTATKELKYLMKFVSAV